MEESDDSGIQHSVRDFCSLAFDKAGVPLDWQGTGLEETGFCRKTGRKLISVDPSIFRPTEVETLLGDPTKAKTKLDWKPKYDLEALLEDMMSADLREAEKQALLKDKGYMVLDQQE